jgi:hypothetical protein
MADQRMKYIVINNQDPIVFPITIPHKWFVDIGLYKDCITSAGFADIYIKDGNIEVEVSGGSQSLGLESKEEDAEKIKMKLMLW